MKQSRFWIGFLIFGFFLVLWSIPGMSFAAPAAPDVIEMQQPDGNRFRGKIIGDEWDSRVETEDGYTVAEDAQGVWKHVAFFNGDHPVLSEIPAHRPPLNIQKGERPALEFMKKGPPNKAELLDELLSAGGLQSSSGLEDGPAGSLELPQSAPFGTHNGSVLFILASFSNRAGTYDEASFASFISNDIADFFSKSSYGKATLAPADESYGAANNGVVGWVNVGTTHPNTGDNTGTANQTLTRNAILAADPYVDFGAYDKNFDGYVDSDELAVVVIAAGYERSSGTTTPNVWGHKWSLTTPAVVDGVTVGAYNGGKGGYAQFGEIHVNHQATAGIMVHELGHLIYGFPDLYDTDYSANGIGSWCVMSGGSWGRRAEDTYSGQTPVLPSAYIKYLAGWVDGAEGAGLTSIKAAGAATATSSNAVYKLTTSVANEYFLVENRQPLGYDEGLEATLGNSFSGGLAIWHVDSSKPSNTAEWYPGLSAINHLKVALEQADGLWQLEKNLSSGNTADLYRSGSTFTGASTPNSMLYSGAASFAEVTAVSVSGETMTATLASTATPCGVPTSIAVPGSSTGSYTVSWGASSTPSVIYELQESMTSDFSSGVMTAYGGTALSTALAKTADGTLYYRVRATRAGYASSNWVVGGNSCVVTLAPAGTPASITVPATDNTGSYTVSWGASATAGVSYALEEATTSGFSANLKTVYTGTATSFVVTGNGNNSYYYRVRATKAGYNPSAWRTGGNGCSVTLTTDAPAAIVVPTTNSDGVYTLTWTPSVTAGVLYELQEATDSNFTQNLKTLYTGSVEGWTIVGQANGSYYYRVRSVKADYTTSAWRVGGNSCTVTLEVCEVPSTLVVPAANNTGVMYLAWTASTTAKVTYEVQMASDAGFSSNLINVANRSTRLKINFAADGTHYWRVRAVKQGYSPSEWLVGGNPTAVALACSAPSLVKVPVTNTTGAFTVSWGKSDVAKVSYELQRATNAAFTAGLVTLYDGPRSAFKENIEVDGDYYYRVKAYKSGYDESGWTVAANSCAVTLTTLVAPASITVPGTNATGTFELNWAATDLLGVLYEVEQAFDAAFTSGVKRVYYGRNLLATVKVIQDGSHYYRVRAVKKGYLSSPWKTSGAVTVSLPSPLESVANLTIPAVNLNGKITVTWDKLSIRGVRYQLQMAENASFTSNLQTVYESTGNKKVVTVGTNGSYYFRVRATLLSQEASAWSNGGNPSVVTLTCATPAKIKVPLSDYTGLVRVSWSRTDVKGATYVLQKSTTADFSANVTPVYSGTKTNTYVPITEDTTWYFRVMAFATGYVDSGWQSLAAGCEVARVCPVASVSVPKASKNGTIKVKWQKSRVKNVYYALEEATSEDFSNAKLIYVGPSYGLTLAGKNNGSYYYRVKVFRTEYESSPWTAGRYGCLVTLL